MKTKEKAKPRLLYGGMGLIAAFCLTLLLLITAVEAVVYWNDGYFEREYEKYHVTERVGMEMEDLLAVTDEMMAYLKGEREDLVIETVVNGAEREFFNEREKLHMEDVRGLFLGAMKLRLRAGVLALFLGGVLLWKRQGLLLLRMLRWGIGLFIGVILYFSEVGGFVF